MHAYPQNSPEAMSRVLAMMIVTDAHIDDREIAILDRMNAYGLLGIDRASFMRVARDYCGDLVAEAEQEGGAPVLDMARADEVIGCVDHSPSRMLLARLLMAVLVSDHRQSETELVLFEHVLDRWALTREQVAPESTLP